MNFRNNITTIKKWSFRGSCVVLGTAIYQGIQARDEYRTNKRLLPPAGPISGVIEWTENIIHVKIKTIAETIKNKKDALVTEFSLEELNLKKRIEDSLNELRQKAAEARITFSKESILRKLKEPAVNSKPKNKRKKIKLLLIGDSLACGVGCESVDNSGPAFPNMLGKVLSIGLQCEIEW
jgi:hypothetical protein